MAEEIFQKLASSVIAHDKQSALEAVQKGIDAGLSADEMVKQGLLEGIKVVCDKMKQDTISVAECVWSVDTFYESLKILSPHLSAHRIPVKKRVVVGVVEGDLHDIGKTIVDKMMQIANFEVYDLGRDVPVERFVPTQTGYSLSYRYRPTLRIFGGPTKDCGPMLPHRPEIHLADITMARPQVCPLK